STVDGINYDLLKILRRCNFYELSKQLHNHTTQRIELLYNLFAYYFQNELGYLSIGNYTKIDDDIRARFFNNSFILYKKKKLSFEQKNGIELYFLLYLYYGVEHFNWHTNKKKQMFRELCSMKNRPILAAVGSLWFGHIFNRFQTDDLQIFIHVIATKYPEAAPWVLTYIEQTNYKQYCLQKNISYAELKPLRDGYPNIWLDGIFYSALPYYYSNGTRHNLFPKVSLPPIYY
ncbi:MAG: hypothetical protein IIW13_05425, partial [Paludibacteraceae bacterium]|nr:hypothetical protein [Paludibacteraceae bacterium]